MDGDLGAVGVGGRIREAEQAAEAQEARDAQEAAAETMAAPEGDLPGEGDRDMWQADGLGSGKRADDDETSALDMMAVPTSLATHLHGQLAVLPLSLRDLVLAKVIVESLDDDGYLRTDLQEMIEVADLDPAATLEEMQIALKRVQALERAQRAQPAARRTRATPKPE